MNVVYVQLDQLGIIVIFVQIKMDMVLQTWSSLTWKHSNYSVKWVLTFKPEAMTDNTNYFCFKLMYGGKHN